MISVLIILEDNSHIFDILNPDGHFKIPHLWPPQNPPPRNQILALDSG